MGIVKGGALRIFQSFLYLLAFCCAAIILGIYSYFLAVLADRDAYISRDAKAVEGISGAAVLYTIFAVVLTCCLGGISFFAFLGIVLDIAFVGGFIALAILTRQGAYSCSGDFPFSPIRGSLSNQATGFTNGAGQSEWTYSVSPITACRMNKACFAVAIIGCFVFLATAAMQVALARHHKKEKRFGPSPSNGYTAGSGKKKGLFARRKNRDAEAGLAPAAVDTRPSHDTAYTGTTINNGVHTHDKVEPNPYGYNNTATTGTATNY